MFETCNGVVYRCWLNPWLNWNHCGSEELVTSHLSIVSYLYVLLLRGWGWVRSLNLVGDVRSFCSHTCIYTMYTNLEINK